MRFITPLFICTALCLTACAPDPISSFMGPQLLANSPVHFGDSPQGIRSRGRLVITNGGDGPLKINDFKIEPDDGVFQVGVSELPLTIAGRRSAEITIQFWPRDIGAFRSELSFDSNHDGNTLSPIALLGNGISNEVCLPCTPAPEPECNYDFASSLVYVPFTSTNCESESGECSYRVIEIPCDNEECDPDTGLCPNGVIPTFDAGPEPAVCGDGTQEDGEECDDGNTTNGDGCSASCVVEEGWDCTEEPCEPICGDGEILGSEECDDGNTTNGDGCSENCTLEAGWDCTDEPCETICGDGIQAGAEECDDGDNDNSDTTPDACRTDCTLPICGDNVQDSGEACDDGNTIIEACDYGDDACTVCGTTCTLVPGVTSLCGDGVVQEPEECDNGDLNSLDTPDACRENCVLAHCGDDTRDSNEGCDDGNTSNGDGCSETCSVEDGWDCNEAPCVTICGDGIQTGAEACDDAGESATCDVDCTLAICGDNVVNMTAGEECDDGTDSATGNSNQRADACRMTCIPHSCGDGFVDSDESCDDDNTDSGDGCDATCAVEAGWTCEGDNPSVCTEIDSLCGDAIWLMGASGFVTDTYGDSDNLRSENYTNGSSYISSCTNDTHDFGDSDGPDTVYAVTLEPGDTFSVDDANTANNVYDISIYLLDSCDTDTGTCLVGSDTTVEGGAENLSYLFNGSSSQTFYFIVDSWCHGSECPSTASAYSFNWSITPAPYCGDGIIQNGESCDDGNNLPNDGCSTACLVEDGWDCTSDDPSICTEAGVRFGGETCSDATVLNTSSGSLVGYYGEVDDYDPYNHSTHLSYTCTNATGADGPEAVYAIELTNNDTLHVEVGPQTQSDISLLIRTCPPSSTSCVAGADEYVANGGGIEIFDFTFNDAERTTKRVLFTSLLMPTAIWVRAIVLHPPTLLNSAGK